jgi:hypothetical protein
MNLWIIPGKPLPFFLHGIEISKTRYDMHGDRLGDGGVEIGVFVRTTPSGKGLTCRRPMSGVVRHISNTSTDSAKERSYVVKHMPYLAAVWRTR